VNFLQEESFHENILENKKNRKNLLGNETFCKNFLENENFSKYKNFCKNFHKNQNFPDKEMSQVLQKCADFCLIFAFRENEKSISCKP